MHNNSQKMRVSWSKMKQIMMEMQELLSRSNGNYHSCKQSFFHKVSHPKDFYNAQRYRLTEHLKQLYQELIDQQNRRQRQTSRQLVLYQDSLTECEQQDTNRSSVYFSQNNELNQQQGNKTYYLWKRKEMKDLIYCWNELHLMMNKFSLLIKELFRDHSQFLQTNELDFTIVLELIDSIQDKQVLKQAIKRQVTYQLKTLDFKKSQTEANSHLSLELNRQTGLQHMFLNQIQNTKRLLQTMEQSLNSSEYIKGNLLQNINSLLSYNEEISLDISQLINKEAINKCSNEYFIPLEQGNRYEQKDKASNPCQEFQEIIDQQVEKSSQLLLST